MMIFCTSVSILVYFLYHESMLIFVIRGTHIVYMCSLRTKAHNTTYRIPLAFIKADIKLTLFIKKMYYLIQKNVFQDARYDEIFTVMDKLKLDYEKVEFKPNSAAFDIQTDRKDIFVYGSVKLAKVTAEFDWHPGSFYGKNHVFEQYVKGYGKNTLNYESQLCNFKEAIDWSKSATLFIKPSKEAKIFTGKVFNESEWNDFVYNKLNDPNERSINEHTKIQVSLPHFLIKEARVWIVGAKVITSSYYKFHGDVEFEEHVSKDGLNFAQQMAALYNVADAYVMDIVYTIDGWKIMEINCINSAGFYKGNVMKIILALEKFYKNE